jgi:hypothetical protein
MLIEEEGFLRVIIDLCVTFLLLYVLLTIPLRFFLNADNPTEWPLYNNTKIAVKLGIVLIILVLGYRQNKKTVFTTKTWATMLGLTLTNIVIAYAWH